MIFKFLELGFVKSVLCEKIELTKFDLPVFVLFFLFLFLFLIVMEYILAWGLPKLEKGQPTAGGSHTAGSRKGQELETW